MEKEWLQTRTREELRRTLGWGRPPVIITRDTFSAHHPMIPRRYVPEWQLDMKNRRNIIKVISYISEWTLAKVLKLTITYVLLSRLVCLQVIRRGGGT